MDASRLELRLPPPAVAVFVALLMWIASRFADPLPVPPMVKLVLAIAIAGAGLAVGVTAMVTFSRAGTTVDPTRPESTQVLVTHGLYRCSRNPMYVSLLLYLVAWAVHLASWASALGLPLFVLYIGRFQIRPEERALAQRFPAEFDAYRRAVRRWL